MAHGYLNPWTEQYLKFLVSRAFLEEKKSALDGKIVVSMHDIMHDVALYLTGDELLSIMVDDATTSGGTLESTSKRGRNSTKARHVIINGKINQTSIGFDLGKVRTCILLKVPSNVTSDLMKLLKMVRLLNLEGCDLKQVPESIMNLIHLRMLVLSDNPMVELPETIYHLFNLQHLFLDGLSLSSLPPSLGKLVNLISLTPCDLALEKAPKLVAKLINLQSMDRIQIGAGNSHMGLLKDLNELRVLEIVFRSNYDDEVDAKKAEIGRKKHLTVLGLYFNQYKVADGVVAALKPPPDIETLKISGLLPGWIIFLHHLKDLHIHGEEFSTSPPLLKLKFLEKLAISGSGSVRTIDRKFLGMNYRHKRNFCAFTMLVELIFDKCYALREFEDLYPQEDEVKVMPNLEILTFTYCFEFGDIPFRLLRQASLKDYANIDQSNEWFKLTKDIEGGSRPSSSFVQQQELHKSSSDHAVLCT